MSSQIEKVVYLVRHGQSDANVAPVYQGPDAQLSDAGKVQAKKIAVRAAGLRFGALIASPYPRAKETADIVGQTVGITPEISELFKERVRPSGINGKSRNDPEANAVYDEWSKSFFNPGIIVQDADNYETIVQRADEALQYLMRRSEDHIFVVTHSFFLRTIIARVVLKDSLGPETFKHFHNIASTENTGISVIRFLVDDQGEGRWQLWIYNDHAHLAE